MKTIYRILLGVIAILALIFVPLAEKAQPALAQGNGCTASSPTSGAYTTTVCITSPALGSTLTANNIVTATVSVTGTNPGVQRVLFYLNGAYLLTDYQSTYTFTLPTTKWIDGSYTISVAAVMRDGFTTQQASISVKFNNGIIIQPVNTNRFQPSTGIIPPAGTPFVVAAGGDGASGEAKATKVSDLITSLNPNLFLYLGDVYEQGSYTEFYNWYGTDSTAFGRLRSITNPTIGNHEYLSSNSGAGYFDYWNNIPNYYSYNAGGWHFISLNSNAANFPVGASSAEYQWLQQDLAANIGICTIAYYHHPLFDIGPERPATSMSSIWSLLAQYGVDIVLNGHDHDYQRWVPLDGSGNPSPTGITEFIIGSAGHGLQTIKNSDSRVAYSNSSSPAAYGILLLQLGQSGANFSYQSINGTTLDSGFVPCVATNPPTPTPTATATPLPTATVMASQSITFTPVADTYVNAGSPDTNYGTSAFLREDGSPDLHSYLRFSVSGLNGKTIVKARLLFYANSSSTQGVNALAVADNTWGEMTTTYTNAPALGGTLASSGAFASANWVTFDVTSYVTGEGTYSFGITTPSSAAISLASHESGANAPQLIIDIQ